MVPVADERVDPVALLGRAIELEPVALPLLIARPDRESIKFPELSTIRVLEPDVPVLLTAEVRFPLVAVLS